jgi:hypothetical protein
MYPPQLPAFLKQSLYVALVGLVRLKWLTDSRVLPLRAHDWKLYFDIHVASALRLKRLPNLRNPVGYNDQVKWLMLFAQHELMPLCADKIRVRDYVANKIGSQHLIPLRATADSWSDIVPALRDGPGVLKCSNDSGSTTLFDDLGDLQIEKLERRYAGRLSREYGVGKGEWHYGGIRPRFLVEERLPGATPHVGPADIKIHCVRGKPALVHIIDSRQSNSRQAFFSPDGEPRNVKVKTHRETIVGYDFKPVRAKILPLARILSEPFRYVRVDFYLIGDTPYFGELTFFEEAGLFTNRSEENDLGEALGLTCDDPAPTIHHSLAAREYA